MPDNLNNESMSPEHLPANDPNPETLPPEFVTREDLRRFAEEISARLPEAPAMPPDDPATAFEERVVERLNGMLTRTFAPVLDAQLAQRLGGEAALEYLSELSPQERMLVSQIPGVARAIREATQARSGTAGRAPRSEGAYAPDDALTPSLQREIDRAFPAYESAFGVSKAQFTKMVLQRQGGSMGGDR